MDIHNISFPGEMKKKNVITFWLEKVPYLELWQRLRDYLCLLPEKIFESWLFKNHAD